MERDLEVRPVVGCGRGVFALRPFERGEAIEVCYVYVVVEHRQEFEDGGLDAYEMAWGYGKVAFATGLAHLYNHSARPNVRFERNLQRGILTVRALRAIKPGTELRHRYACAPWFKVVR